MPLRAATPAAAAVPGFPTTLPELEGAVRGWVVCGDNLPLLRRLPDACAGLIYLDPPFNTGRVQTRRRLRTVAAADGDRTGFGGRRYRSEVLGVSSFADRFDDYLAFLAPRLSEAFRLLGPTGTLYFHGDCREIHYCKVLLDDIFGRERFLNEVIWAYDFGGRSRRCWPRKHDNILVYVKDPARYTFDHDAVDRLPYLAPGLAGPQKAARGKFPTDTWWHTIVPTSGRERTGYPTQKPLGILRRIVRASSRRGDLVLDFFAGSGTTGAACQELGRRFLLIDDSAEACAVMRRRLGSGPDLVFLAPGPAIATPDV